MRGGTFAALFACFLVAQSVSWYLFVLLLSYVVKGVRSEWMKRSQVQSVSRNSRVKALSLLCASFSLCYQTMLWRCFLEGWDDTSVVWQSDLGRPYHTTLILLCMLSFATLLCVSLLRLRFVFAHTVFNVSSKKIRCYLCAIGVHALIELASIFTSNEQNQWLLWIIYDCLLTLLSSALCYDITTRLMRVVTLVTGDIPGCGYKMKMNTNSHRGSAAEISAMESSLRYGTFSLHQIQLFRVASKLTVLSVTLNIAALLWTLSPLILLLTGSQTHGVWFEIVFALEIFNHIVVFTVSMLVCLLSFSAGDRIYNSLCSKTGHACAMRCFLSSVQARVMQAHIDHAHSHGGQQYWKYSDETGARDTCTGSLRLRPWNQIDHSQAFRLSHDFID